MIDIYQILIKVFLKKKIQGRTHFSTTYPMACTIIIFRPYVNNDYLNKSDANISNYVKDFHTEFSTSIDFKYFRFSKKKRLSMTNLITLNGIYKHKYFVLS